MADVAKNKKTMNIVTSEVVVTDGAERGKEAVEEYEEEELGHAGEKDRKFILFVGIKNPVYLEYDCVQRHAACIPKRAFSVTQD